MATIAATLAAVVLTATAGLADTHTVSGGETLGRIARRYGTTSDAIAQANGISDVNHITPGMVLVIPTAAPAPAPDPATAAQAPAPAPAPAPAASGPMHTVRGGETLFKIAQRYGTTVDAIVAANGITDRGTIVAGQVFVIPVAAPAAAPAPAPAAPAPAPAPAAPAAPAGPAPSGTVHTVGAGDTLGRIARRYGTTVDDILALNPATDRSIIHAGELLAIPAVAAAPPAGVYVVQPGDALASVAARHGLSVESLAAANGLAPTDMLIAGNRLYLNVQNGVAAASLGACPVPGARFQNDFGFPRADGRFHDGVDLFAPAGTPVLAPVSGRLQRLTGPVGGNQFILRGDDGHRYAGSHLSAFGAAGRVSAGSVIGYVGNTGNAAGADPHLHFEVRPGGGPSVNPYSVVDAAC